MMRLLQATITWIVGHRALSFVVVVAIYCLIVVVGAQWTHAPAKMAANGSKAFPIPPSVEDAFNTLYDEQSEYLGGKKQGGIKRGSIAYQAWHEHAIVVWIKDPQSLVCVVPKDAGAGHSAFCENDPFWTPDPIYYGNSEKLRAKFLDLPEDKLPPGGGIAQHWLRNPEKWQWIGYVEQECELDSSLYYWRLSNGWIIGVFRYNDKNPTGEIFSISEEGKSSSLATANASDCKPVARPK